MRHDVIASGAESWRNSNILINFQEAKTETDWTHRHRQMAIAIVVNSACVAAAAPDATDDSLSDAGDYSQRHWRLRQPQQPH